MNPQPQGELVPIGGGDSIPLLRSPMKIGRRDSCDICLRFPNISGLHSELTFVDGFWMISDLGSTNGTKVNGTRVQRKLLRPGDELSFAKRRFRIEYQITGEINRHIVIDEDEEEDVLNIPLLERAGLARRQRDDEDTPRVPRRHER
jgi:pSer/pThr/pTyr-binding forkhead associated (FHA) protein